MKRILQTSPSKNLNEIYSNSKWLSIFSTKNDIQLVFYQKALPDGMCFSTSIVSFRHGMTFEKNWLSFYEQENKYLILPI